MEVFYIVAVKILFNREPILIPVTNGERYESKQACEETLIEYLIEGSKAERIAGNLVVIQDGNGWSTTRSCLRLPKN
jgi:hypothetical protein